MKKVTEQEKQSVKVNKQIDDVLVFSGIMKEIKLNKNSFNENEENETNFQLTDDEFLNSLNITIQMIIEELTGKYRILYDYAVKMKHHKKNCDDFILEWDDKTIPTLEKRVDQNLFYFLENDMEKAREARESIYYINKNLSTVKYLKREYVKSKAKIEKNNNELGRVSVEY